jgi:carboxymethylenebutenolidase
MSKTKWVVVLLLLILPMSVFAQDVQSGDVDIVSGGRSYQSYLAAPSESGSYPAIVLIHSFNGLEEGYRTMSDELSGEGFVVLAVGWQTFERSPDDATVMQLVEDSIAFLRERDDVNKELIGLTGFCAGGRYTMLFLPQIKDFKAGVAWYGFPNNGAPAPVDFIDQLTAPMLIIHGTADQSSPIGTIYDYAAKLAQAQATFEMKIYSGEPHGFMLANGQLRQDEVAQSAFNEMADFFKRKLLSS